MKIASDILAIPRAGWEACTRAWNNLTPVQGFALVAGLAAMAGIAGIIWRAASDDTSRNARK